MKFDYRLLRRLSLALVLSMLFPFLTGCQNQIVEKVGVPFTQAVDFATINPAKNLKIDHEVGSIAVGKRADFTVINENYDVLMTVRGGEIIYKA